MLIGPPGVGKSTTACRVAFRLLEKGYVPVVVRPGTGTRAGVEDVVGMRVPYLELPPEEDPELLRTLVHLAREAERILEDPELRRELEEVLESVAERASRGERPGGEAERLRRAVGKAVGAFAREVLTEAAGRAVAILWRVAVLPILPLSVLVEALIVAGAVVASEARRYVKERELREAPERLVLVVDGLEVGRLGVSYGDRLERDYPRVGQLLEDLRRLEARRLYVVRIDPSMLVDYALASLLAKERMPEGWREKFVRRDFAPFPILLGTVYAVEEARGLEHSVGREEALEALRWDILRYPGTSTEVYEDILTGLVEGRVGYAAEIARLASELSLPFPGGLFRELGEALLEEDMKATLDALVKLFYYHV